MPAPSDLSSGTFRYEGEYWTIAYQEEVCHLRDTRGLRLLVLLLQRPGRKVRATELARAGATAGNPPGTGAAVAGSEPRTAEHARLNVSRALKLALDKLSEHCPQLGAHLRSTVRTGTYCIYDPDPRVPIAWRTGGEPPEPDRS